LSRGKQGYSLPIKNWLRSELKDYMTDLLDSSPVIMQHFNKACVRRLIQEHLSYRQNHNHILWALTNLAVWHRRVLEGATSTGNEHLEAQSSLMRGAQG
jgi:asparagine synthase (glutamine-hydrolysing)